MLARKYLGRLAGFVTENGLKSLPILHAFRGYRRPDLMADTRAGANVALLAFPQGMAYATIADLPIQYGIMGTAISAIVAPFFSGSRHTVLGPTNATAFMVFSTMGMMMHSERVELLPMLMLMVGLLLVFGALLRVADLIQYISRSVVVGYISGAAILIIVNQLRHIFGIDLAADPGVDGAIEAGRAAPRTFFTVLGAVLRHIGSTRWEPVVYSLLTFGVWVLLMKRLRRLPVFASTLAVMTMLYAGIEAYNFTAARHPGWHPIPFELDTFESFTLADLRPRLPSIGAGGLFYDIHRLIGIAFSIAFLAALENSVMSKSLASLSGDRPDLNQDMLSVGVANIANAFTGGMPASGSLTRCALNFGSGAVSRLSSIISGLLCGAGIVVLGRFIRHVPKCSLAVLIVCIAWSVINRRHVRIALNATTADAAVLITTFVSALVMPLSVAIFLGVGVSIMLYLRKASRPHLTEYEFSEGGELREAGEKRRRPIPAISIVHVEGDLFFGAAELFRTQIQKTCLDPALKIIILRLKNARHLDATSVMALEELIRFVRSSSRDVIISGASKDVYRVLKNAGMVEVIGRDNIFLNSPRNPNLSTRNALKRAQQLLGTTKADIRIFYDPSKDKEGGGSAMG
ncbi:MAG: SulP family inorganic anion transporter [Verrucomicrobiae bacterium]|nr:SulP family inorganic anion transporter [Verrucomicrobiae bacterium]MCP5541198.1 SulP family inorganic anion transporter [Akkermansiaceae bacterium]MCP5550462.1 SulP family inorganic anion transporter [Akkermansiaceae bacterium]